MNDVNNFRSKGPELLVELAQHTACTVSEIIHVEPALADNEHLRDALRLSEDPKRPERKVQFFIAVYQHLRERIRQDIIRTDDPVDAIEQMEIE
uniref:hypothetical protein n=1 Tax=Photorhabdus sp. CRCIA-P01 TaxID=2019570 RepID=UPI00130086E1